MMRFRCSRMRWWLRSNQSYRGCVIRSLLCVWNLRNNQIDLHFLIGKDSFTPRLEGLTRSCPPEWKADRLTTTGVDDTNRIVSWTWIAHIIASLHNFIEAGWSKIGSIIVRPIIKASRCRQTTISIAAVGLSDTATHCAIRTDIVGRVVCIRLRKLNVVIVLGANIGWKSRCRSEKKYVEIVIRKVKSSMWKP